MSCEGPGARSPEIRIVNYSLEHDFPGQWRNKAKECYIGQDAIGRCLGSWCVNQVRCYGWSLVFGVVFPFTYMLIVLTPWWHSEMKVQEKNNWIKNFLLSHWAESLEFEFSNFKVILTFILSTIWISAQVCSITLLACWYLISLVCCEICIHGINCRLKILKFYLCKLMDPYHNF